MSENEASGLAPFSFVKEACYFNSEEMPELYLTHRVVMRYVGLSLRLGRTGKPCGVGVYQYVYFGQLRNCSFALVYVIAKHPEHRIVSYTGIHKGYTVIRGIPTELTAYVLDEISKMLAVILCAILKEGIGLALHPAHTLDLHVIVFGNEIGYARIYKRHKLLVEITRSALASGREPLFKEICAAPSTLYDNKGFVGVQLVELFRKTKLGAEGSFKLAL